MDCVFIRIRGAWSGSISKWDGSETLLENILRICAEEDWDSVGAKWEIIREGTGNGNIYGYDGKCELGVDVDTILS